MIVYCELVFVVIFVRLARSALYGITGSPNQYLFIIVVGNEMHVKFW